MKRVISRISDELNINPLRSLIILFFIIYFIAIFFDFYLMIRLTLLSVIGCTLAFLTNYPLKMLFRTKRPILDKYQDIEYGFPSFHSQVAFTIATIYSFYFHALFLPTFIFATFVGISRLVTKSHNFMDVAFGGILGILTGIVMLIV